MWSLEARAAPGASTSRPPGASELLVDQAHGFCSGLSPDCLLNWIPLLSPASCLRFLSAPLPPYSCACLVGLCPRAVGKQGLSCHGERSTGSHTDAANAIRVFSFPLPRPLYRHLLSHFYPSRLFSRCLHPPSRLAMPASPRPDPAQRHHGMGISARKVEVLVPVPMSAATWSPIDDARIALVEDAE